MDTEYTPARWVDDNIKTVGCTCNRLAQDRGEFHKPREVYAQWVEKG